MIDESVFIVAEEDKDIKSYHNGNYVHIKQLTDKEFNLSFTKDFKKAILFVRFEDAQKFADYLSATSANFVREFATRESKFTVTCVNKSELES